MGNKGRFIKMNKSQKKEYDGKRYLTKKTINKKVFNEELLSETDIAYLAGLIDGEGCFSINYYKNTDKYVPYISISMTNEDVLKHISKIFNVKYFQVKRNGNIPCFVPLLYFFFKRFFYWIIFILTL